MKVLILLLAFVAISYGQMLPREWQHFNKIIQCTAIGHQARGVGDPRQGYYRFRLLRMCPVGLRFSMEVCTCITDPTQAAVIPNRPFCERILNFTGTEDLQRSSNGKALEYSGDSANIFRNGEAICYREGFFAIPYLESNDFGNTMNIRFSVRFMNIAGLTNNNDADTIILLSNGNCGTPRQPTLRIGYTPNNDSYIFLADRVFYTCRMTPRRAIQNRNTIDVIDWRFFKGALSVTINDQLINRSGCTVSPIQNIFSNFNYKFRTTSCPLRIGQVGGRIADVCLSNMQINRDCIPGQ